ncbi:MAG: copper resistance protein CopC/CopD [Gemmatimonadaceae bacterium]|nr:copper resistance protein CopC/CopD [Gemmatimonadaceae bacterium]
MLHLTLPLLVALLMPMHTRLARSEPAVDAVVTSSPRELRLWFEGGMEAHFTQVALRGSAGARMALGAPVRGSEPGLIVVPVPMTLRPDHYTVAWETVGRDGHPMRGTFRFMLAAPDGTIPHAEMPSVVDSSAWGAGTAGRTVTGGAVSAEAGPEGRSTRSASQFARASRPVRWVELTALVTALGAVALLLGVLRTGRGGAAHERFIADAVRRVTILGTGGAAMFLAASVSRFAIESQTLHGGSGGMSPGSLARTAATGWGRAWVIAAAAMAMLLVVLLYRQRAARAATGAPAPRGGDLALGVAALAAAIGPAMTGHAASAVSLMPLAVLADWLHVIGASAWVGGVAGLALAASPAALAQPPGDRAAAMAWLVGAFHALAVPSIALVVFSGVVSGWLRVGTWRDLMASNYGDLLLFKVYLVAFTALLGAYHWFRVHPRLMAAAAGDDRTARHLQWTLAVEVAVSLFILGLTATLVTTPPPR